ncbi:MAG: ABC transporter ATP-binding protein [Sneathiellales bacterium]|nr:ABC transporter ATP-binding protein [Sneathiellales bacterium]
MNLKVENVSAGYGSVQILNNLSFPDITQGQLVGLLGPNASGKSTLLRCLSGILAFKGHISFAGQEYSKTNHKAWFEKVATMPQSPPAPTALTPTELLWSTARALALPYSDQALAHRIEDLFTSLGIYEYRLSALSSLSGGKRQLVGLALALIREPELMLLDEPTSALDLHWRMTVLQLVQQRIKTQNQIAVAALHDLDLAARYCDTLVLMHQGVVVAAGAPETVLVEDNIARVYQVEAKISRSPYGHLHIDVIGPLPGSSPHV